MATDRQRARGRPHRVVLRGKKQQQAALLDDGAGIKATVSDTELKPSALLIGKSLSDHHAPAWRSAPLINDIDSDTNNLGERVDEIHPMHSTPTNSTAEGATVHESHESPIVNTTTSESSSEEEEREREGERRIEACDSHSDDVFLGNSPIHVGKGGTPIKLSQSDSKVACSLSGLDDRGSESKDKLLENDQLPPLPTSRRRHQRPYTSPGRNSSSCSTDSYTSPIHSRTLLPSSGGSAEGQLSTVGRKPQKSGKTSRKGGRRRSTRVHPEDNRPPNLKLPSPIRSTTTTLKSTTFSSKGMDKRTLSSTDSMSSTFSATLTPLLTSSLRKGGGGSQPAGSGSSWGFDAEAHLESCFPDRHMQVLVVTWNMQQQKVRY